MWRGFASTLSNKTYENYLKKYDRMENNLFGKTTGEKDLEKGKNECLEARQLVHDYENLQRKVVEQRKLIKEAEEIQERRKKIKFELVNKARVDEKLKKFEQLKKIRSFSQNKTRKIQSLDLRPKKIENENTQESMFLTNFRSRSPLRSFRPSSKVSTVQRSRVSLREYQERVLKEMKEKIPTYFKNLKEEFLEIRKKSEETFEQYVNSKKIRWSSPFNIKIKNKGNGKDEELI